jgi:hypothetical protein
MVNLTSGAGASMAIAVDAAVVPNTEVPIQAAPGELTGDSILTLTAGDIVTLRDDSGTPVSLTPSGVGASLAISSLG